MLEADSANQNTGEESNDDVAMDTDSGADDKPSDMEATVDEGEPMDHD